MSLSKPIVVARGQGTLPGPLWASGAQTHGLPVEDVLCQYRLKPSGAPEQLFAGDARLGMREAGQT